MACPIQIDLAFMLVTRDISFDRCSFKFGWADSSPQGPFDFLLWKYRQIFSSDLLATAAAMTTLITLAGKVLGGKLDDYEEAQLSTMEARIVANRVLKKNVREHLCVPLFVGCVLFVLFPCCRGVLNS